MDRDSENKILAALKQQARKLADFPLFKMGKNCKIGLEKFLQTLIDAAARRHSPEQASKLHNPDTLYHHLNNKLSVESAEAMLKSHVSGRDLVLLRRRFGGRLVCIAIDFTDDMFYGKKDTVGVVGTKHKNGSNHAFRYMTVNIVTPGGRFLIWAYPMFHRQETLWMLNQALMKIDEFGIKPHLLVVDREFNYTDALALIGEKFPYLTPADQDKKFRKHVKGKALPSYCDDWRIMNKDREEISTQLVVLQEGKHKYGYLTNLPHEFFRGDYELLSELYSKRWGIETAHRCEDKFRIFTTCKTAAVRYLYFVIGVLLYNLWVWLNLFFNFDIVRFSVTIEWMKEKLAAIFDEFYRLLLSPERWFSCQLENFGGVAFCTLQPCAAMRQSKLPTEETAGL